MFVDKVQVNVQAGDGGDGNVSFRHEKFIDKGGPNGGDGGNGGDVVMLASRNQNTLASFRYQRLLKAASGQVGGKSNKHGKSGEDLVVAVPVGTVVVSAEGEVIADLAEDGQQAVIARGGKGGFGNAHFISSTRQAPRVAEKGEPGDQLEATLELKMIADVGLVGLPNAGKSTLLAATSNARPEIADYPFTTLRPNLGMVPVDKSTSLLVADIPGLIEGASQGKGLGDDFLRHIERTSVLIHLIDVYEEDVANAYQTVQKELTSYQAAPAFSASPGRSTGLPRPAPVALADPSDSENAGAATVRLSDKPQIVALNKIDGLDDDIVQAKLAELKRVVPKNALLFAISAQSKQGVKELLYKANELVTNQRQQAAEQQAEELPVIRLDKEDDSWKITKTDDGFVVVGRKVERFARRTDFDNPHSVARLRDIMKKMGIMPKLVRQGIEPGQKIYINKWGSIEY
jgi:GTP-binding protein